MHFQTKTTIDTLDYSGENLNEGSKVIIAAAGRKKRKLAKSLPSINLCEGFTSFKLINQGILAIEGFGDINNLIVSLEKQNIEEIALITLVDDVNFVRKNFSNWIWVTFTRSDPAKDIYGLNTKIKDKHFSCSVPIIDARIKPHHAPVLES